MNPAKEHNSLKTLGIEHRSVIDGDLMADRPELATVKEFLTVQDDENRRIAEARQADAELIAKVMDPPPEAVHEDDFGHCLG